MPEKSYLIIENGKEITMYDRQKALSHCYQKMQYEKKHNRQGTMIFQPMRNGKSVKIGRVEWRWE